LRVELGMLDRTAHERSLQAARQYLVDHLAGGAGAQHEVNSGERRHSR
jgi:hypothetical protein